MGLPAIVTAPSGRPAGLARKLALSLPPVRRLVKERDNLRRARRKAENRLGTVRRENAELKRHVAELSAAAPVAGEQTRTQPLQYVFVVTYGRSGSTLVQGLLNAIPGYLIRGENRGALYRLYEYHSVLEAARKEFGRADTLTTKDSWYGIDEYSSSAAITQMRALMLDTLLKPGPDTRVVGFKEIRWFYDDWQKYLRFVRDVFPGAKFVINSRDHDAVASSQWWGKQPKADVLRRLAGYEEQLTAMAEWLGDAAFRIHYDDYVANPANLSGMFEWLGEPFDLAAVTETMAVRHSF
jgi:hypothetical protein